MSFDAETPADIVAVAVARVLDPPAFVRGRLESAFGKFNLALQSLSHPSSGAILRRPVSLLSECKEISRGSLGDDRR